MITRKRRAWAGHLPVWHAQSCHLLSARHAIRVKACGNCNFTSTPRNLTMPIGSCSYITYWILNGQQPCTVTESHSLYTRCPSICRQIAGASGALNHPLASRHPWWENASPRWHLARSNCCQFLSIQCRKQFKKQGDWYTPSSMHGLEDGVKVMGAKANWWKFVMSTLWVILSHFMDRVYALCLAADVLGNYLNLATAVKCKHSIPLQPIKYQVCTYHR